MQKKNIFENIPANLPEEWSEFLVQNGNVRVERIVSRGHSSPDGFWYDQTHDEWVVLLRGGAGLEFEGQNRQMELGPGDHLLIPAHVRHRVAWTADGKDTIWLAVHFDDSFIR